MVAVRRAFPFESRCRAPEAIYPRANMNLSRPNLRANLRRSELGTALEACRNAFIGVGLMSFMINLLYLTGSFFMLEIYDRVLPSRSVPTLVGLSILAAGLYIAQGVLDLIRSRILGRIGSSLDEALDERIYRTVVQLPLIVG